MRKFSLFTLLATLFCCLTASAADYYLIGGFNGWAEADANAKFVATATEGVYELNYAGQLTSGFKVNDGTWKNDLINFGSNGSMLEVGTPYKYGVGGSTGDIKMAKPVDNPHIVLNVTDGTLLVEGEAAEEVITYDIWGGVQGGSWGATTLVENNGKWEGTLNVTVPNYEFGIRELGNGNQTAWYAATAAVTVSETTEVSMKENGTNIKIAEGTYELSFDLEALTLAITKEGSEVDPPVDPEDPEFVVYFDNFNNWSTTAPKIWAWNDGGNLNSAGATFPGDAMTLVEGTLYKWVSDKTPTGIIITNQDEAKAGGGDITNPENGATYYSNGLTTKPVEGEIRVAIAGDFNGWSETANSTTEYGDEGLKRYYIDVENYAGGDNGFKVVVNGKYYGQDGLVLSNGGWVDGITAPEGYGNNITLPASAEGTNVRFMVNLGDDTVNLCAVWVAVPTITYNVAEQDDTFVEFTLSTEGENKIFYQIAGAAAEGMAKAEGEYTEYVAGQTLKVNEGETFSAYAENADASMQSAMVNKTFAQMHSEAVGSGVAAIEIENGAARYFNLEGMEVLNPENGIYIRVANGKAQKVLVK